MNRLDTHHGEAGEYVEPGTSRDSDRPDWPNNSIDDPEIGANEALRRVHELFGNAQEKEQ